MNTNDQNQVLGYLNLARQVAKRAYCPYSNFSVGCVLVDIQGRLFEGCNVENASFSVTLCAERTAGSQAIAQGSRSWDSIFIVSPTRVSPCGTCRQFLYELSPELKVYLSDLESEDFTGPISIQDLLPMGMNLRKTNLPHR
ncbi:MAG: cytidine deaminase [Pirellula sp.]|jgi:cytidine deaminase